MANAGGPFPAILILHEVFGVHGRPGPAQAQKLFVAESAAKPYFSAINGTKRADGIIFVRGILSVFVLR
jgi:dienelactone hydrolase